MVTIEDYKDIYENQIIELWNDQLIFDTINHKRFQQEIRLNQNFDPSLFKVALVSERVVGFIYGVRRKIPYSNRGLEPEKGWLMNLAVSSNYQRKGIGKRLLEALERDLSKYNVSEITLCAMSPDYLTPGIDTRYLNAIHFFESNGYHYLGESVSMRRDLFEYCVGDGFKQLYYKRVNEGFEFENLNAASYRETLAFIEKNFGLGWAQALVRHIEKGSANDCVIIARYNQEIVGFCMRAMDSNPMRYGPIGTSATYRGKQIGTILTHLMFQNMVQNKIYATYFLWTSEPNIRFYQNLGFEIYRTYKMGSKKV